MSAFKTWKKTGNIPDAAFVIEPGLNDQDDSSDDGHDPRAAAAVLPAPVGVWHVLRDPVELRNAWELLQDNDVQDPLEDEDHMVAAVHAMHQQLEEKSGPIARAPRWRQPVDHEQIRRLNAADAQNEIDKLEAGSKASTQMCRIHLRGGSWCLYIKPTRRP